MQQLKLFWTDFVELRKFESENISAIFTHLWDNIHEVILEINSNKFLINFKTAMKTIENLEIIAIKGFVELSISIVKIIRKIVYKLYFEV